MKRLLPLTFGLCLSFFALQAVACSGGQEWRSSQGQYIYDITDDTPVIEPGMAVHFDFGLYGQKTDTYGMPVGAEFSSVQVALLHHGQPVMQKELAMSKDRELTGFDYTFPRENADYALAATYVQHGNRLAAATVPLTVGTGEVSLPRMSAQIAGAAGAVIGVILIGVHFLRRRA